MELFDSHFHWYGEESPEAFCSLLPAGYQFKLMAVGGDFEESCRAQRFAEAIDFAWFAAGVHPHAADRYAGSIAEFDGFNGHPRLKAIGELGLDFFYDQSDRRFQFQVFEKFLALALDWHLPAIIHCRDKDDSDAAYRECYQLVRDFTAAGGSCVIHCFAGTPGWAERFLALGAYLGVTGMVTFPRAANIREVLQLIPADRLLLETDAPYLAPVPYRGQTNHPAYVVEVAKRVAAERHCSPEAVAAQTTANAGAFFQLEDR